MIRQLEVGGLYMVIEGFEALLVFPTQIDGFNLEPGTKILLKELAVDISDDRPDRDQKCLWRFIAEGHVLVAMQDTLQLNLQKMDP